MNSLTELLIPKATSGSHLPSSEPMNLISGTSLPPSRAAGASGTVVHVPMPFRESALSLRGEIFHVFISYRVKSEACLVGELYHKLLTSTKAA